ncbi:hypothetical protein FA13DRAFT_1819658 [Coprinellus micaceus]|uniref:Uncharacterized protein n=1 Tax=Coprinellus micaceus TaxID=71717 RepID=A0A4Y7SHY3_COPMI|nr:hypothetical protein FA13DRAFT_1819658 [Coprinellus micaceus]
MRKVDYLGSDPVASKLLFAPPEPDSEDDLEGDFNSGGMAPQPSSLRNRGSAGEASERGEAEVRASGV